MSPFARSRNPFSINPYRTGLNIACNHVRLKKYIRNRDWNRWPRPTTEHLLSLWLGGFRLKKNNSNFQFRHHHAGYLFARIINGLGFFRIGFEYGAVLEIFTFFGTFRNKRTHSTTLCFISNNMKGRLTKRIINVRWRPPWWSSFFQEIV